jgi:UDP-2-acetamido-3-amino-2,3-dideoxy-glucuronate N-acetyltransferase
LRVSFVANGNAGDLKVKTTGVSIHPSAEVSEQSNIGRGTKIWHQAQVLGAAAIGSDCTVGKGVFVGTGSRIGDLVKIGNYANIFGAMVEDEAFIGPMACILEDRYPRATNLDGTRKGTADFEKSPALIGRGASIGAAAVIMPGVVVGHYAMISAGAIVNKDVPDHAIMVGNPARQIGFACHCGRKLDETLTCECQRIYALTDDGLVFVATR